MKNFKHLISSIKYPKLRLSVLLWAVFLLVILIEAYVLYGSLFLGTDTAGDADSQQAQTITPIDFDSYERTVEWLSEKEVYNLPDYSLEGQTSGRENPFAEYR